jgi:hypothetical protein
LDAVDRGGDDLFVIECKRFVLGRVDSLRGRVDRLGAAGGEREVGEGYGSSRAARNPIKEGWIGTVGARAIHGADAGERPPAARRRCPARLGTVIDRIADR